MDWQEMSGGEHCFLRFRGLEMVHYLRQFTLIIILTRLIADFTASDALVVAELTHLKYPIPGIKMDASLLCLLPRRAQPPPANSPTSPSPAPFSTPLDLSLE